MGHANENEKQVGCYGNLDCVDTFSDTYGHQYTLSDLFVILKMYLLFLCYEWDFMWLQKQFICFYVIILDIKLFTVKNNDFWLKLVHGCIILFYILMRLQRVYVPSYLVTYVT